MSVIDKVLGRMRQMKGDALNEPAERREGLRQERRGEAKEEQAEAEHQAEKKRQEVRDLGGAS